LLTTEVAPRMPGTDSDKAEGERVIKKLNALDFDKVWSEYATFPMLIRNFESAAIISSSTQ
jgi:hypothetical protein